ncbi:MAG: CDP-alcohol phosphatidyltransferase family protein [Verrucomicrobia bacterium]|nr:CDP-alcohol phosphatidyltransferase family protein [Verrucomicrobiota bacterium]
MSVYDLKPQFQNLLRPVCRAMARRGVSANQVTVLALVLASITGGLIAGFCGARWTLLLVPVVLFVRMALNAIDGMLAREHNMRTPLGAVLNELGDVVSDTAIYLPYAVVPGMPALWVVLIVVLAVISEMTGVVAVQIGASRRYDGPMGKSDRALVLGLLALLLGLGVPVGTWLHVFLLVVMLMLGVTIYRRVRRALKECA